MNKDDMSNAEEESILRKHLEEDEDPQSESEDEIPNAQADTKKSNEQQHKQNRKGDSAKSSKNHKSTLTRGTTRPRAKYSENQQAQAQRQPAKIMMTKLQPKKR